MFRLNNFLKKIKLSPKKQSLAELTTFKVGGTTNFFFSPENLLDLYYLFKALIEEDLPFFTLGGGSNILINDKMPQEKIIIHTKLLDKVKIDGESIIAQAGVDFEKLCYFAYENSLSGLEFIYGMPGSLGGAIWMNARCYGSEISQILDSVTFIDERANIVTEKFTSDDFKYKISPFQNKNWLILKAKLNLKKVSERESILREMIKNKKDRESKGHYKYPSAGSTFKNNRKFGSPTGKIIESCNLKGLKCGGASISEFHGNFVINYNHASAQEIKNLIAIVKREVYKKTKFKIEEELLYIGFE